MACACKNKGNAPVKTSVSRQSRPSANGRKISLTSRRITRREIR